MNRGDLVIKWMRNSDHDNIDQVFGIILDGSWTFEEFKIVWSNGQIENVSKGTFQRIALRPSL